MRLRTAGVGVLLLSAGCDTLRGVASRASLSEPVNVGCVADTLSTIPEAGEVTYKQDESRSTQILPKQRRMLTIKHVWSYGEGGQANLWIIQNEDGWKFENSHLRLGPTMPREEIARFIPLMQKVNRAVQVQCGLPVADLDVRVINQPAQ